MKGQTDLYDEALTRVFLALGYHRSGRGLYVRSEDAAVWYGLWVTFNAKKSSLVVQPSLAVFCPAASQMIDEGLGQNVGHDGDGLALKLGHPFVTQLLYDRIRTRTGEGRSSVSYDIIDASLTGDAAKLVGEDFTKVAGDFFDCASSVVELRDEVVTHPSGTGAAMYAMALTYLIDQEITATDIDRLANIRPSPMTTKFASFMKKKINDRRHAAI